MSFWTDLRDAAVAVVTTPLKIVTAPIETVWDVAQGKNVGQASIDLVKKEVGGSILLGSNLGPVLSTDLGQGILHNELLNKVTLGYAGDWGDSIHGAKTLQDDATISKDDLVGTAKFLVKSAAIGGAAALAGGGVAVGGHTVTLTEGLTGVGVGSALLKGDPNGVLGALDIPGSQSFGDTASAINNFFTPSETPMGSAPSPQPGPPTVSEQASSGGDFFSPSSTLKKAASSQTLLYGGLAVGSYLLYRRFKSRG